MHYEGRRVPKSDPFCTEVSFHDVWAIILYKALVGRRVYLGAPFCTSLNQKLCFPRGFPFVLEPFLIVSFWVLYELSSYDSICDVSLYGLYLVAIDHPIGHSCRHSTSPSLISKMGAWEGQWGTWDCIIRAPYFVHGFLVIQIDGGCHSVHDFFLGSMMRDPILY